LKKSYSEVELIFLIAGHSKNICDSKFSTLKQIYHNKNIYSFSKLIPVLNHNPKIRSVDVYTEHFHDWDKFFDVLYHTS